MKNRLFNTIMALAFLIIPVFISCSERKINRNSHANTPMQEPTSEYPGSGAFTKKPDSVRCCIKK